MLTFVPPARLAPWSYAAEGDVLTVSGRAYDFGPLPEGGRLPRAAVEGAWLLSDVIRADGHIRMEVEAPNPETPAEPGPPGVIDWTQAETAEAQAARALAEWRAAALLPVAEFAMAALGAGLIAEAEAQAWVARQALPAAAQAALDTLPEAERLGARLHATGSVNVARLHPLVALIAATMGLTDAQVDALFGAPP